MLEEKLPNPAVVDFETFGIQGRPHYPPVPVGVAIQLPGKQPKYYAWGHLSENNCTWDQAKVALEEAWAVKDGVLFQNGKFDVDVAETHMGMPRLPWDKYHDTLYLLFLDDPHASELGLKPSADRYLNMPPEEQDAVAEWLVANQPVPGIKIGRGRASKHPYGAYIAFAPGKVVGDYAIGDVVRTDKLFRLLWTKLRGRKMLEAYDTERELMPILLEIERQGVPIDLDRLRSDVAMYTETFEKLDQWIRKQLKAPDLDVNKTEQLADYLIAGGLADPQLMGQTPGGKVATNKEAMENGISDKRMASVLRYRAALATCLRTFMVPWLQTAEASGGLIYTYWNQTKQGDGKEMVGTRTGRLSSTPNFQNIPKEFASLFDHEAPGKGLPKAPWKLPPLPMVRSYVVAFDGHVLLDRDYSQQELRILGHYEDGVLMEAYLKEPWLDVHDFARDLINGMLGTDFDRKPIKNTGFGLIYGMGLGKLAIKSNCSVEEAKEVKDAYLKIFPGLKAMYASMKQLMQANEPIITWGGREYYCEPPKVVNGRMMTFDYKMLNVLIQGSAADCTKRAVINYWKLKPKDHYLLLTVHDEILISVPTKQVKTGMEVLRQAMEGVEFSVPMLSEGDIGDNWAALETYDTKGKVVHAH